MKALTIAQPYPTLICLPDGNPRAKRVENRTRRTSHRGDFLIHAGLSRNWLASSSGEPNKDASSFPVDDMAFGAIVAVASLAGCAKIIRTDGLEQPPNFSLLRERDTQADWIESTALARWHWLATHDHARGRWCWVLEDVRPLAEPVPCKGKLGLWSVPEEVATAVGRQIAGSVGLVVAQ